MLIRTRMDVSVDGFSATPDGIPRPSRSPTGGSSRSTSSPIPARLAQLDLMVLDE
jgi:hypothetical protein